MDFPSIHFNPSLLFMRCQFYTGVALSPSLSLSLSLSLSHSISLSPTHCPSLSPRLSVFLSLPLPLSLSLSHPLTLSLLSLSLPLPPLSLSLPLSPPPPRYALNILMARFPLFPPPLQEKNGGKKRLFSKTTVMRQRARRLDKVSRIVFPLVFLVFNIFYWSFYILLED